MKKTYILLSAAALLASCNDYLDAVPSKGENEVLNNAEQVEALFNNSDNFNTKASMVVYSSDDIGYTMELALKIDPSAYWGNEIIHSLSYDIDHVAANQWGDEIWENEWAKVFNANLVLNNLDDVNDIDDNQRATYEAQAHFVRALAYWNLAQTYCQPYGNETLSKPGLPIKRNTSYEEDLTRASIEDTYAFIEADLQEALHTPATDVDADKRWWVSRPAVHAMLARLYLFTGKYAEAAEQAQQALQSQNAQLDDYNQLTTVEHAIVNPEDFSEDKAIYSELYDYSPNKMASYKENFFSQYFEVKSGMVLAPSDELLALYDEENDLRSTFFVKKDLWNIGSDTYGYGDDILYHKFYHYHGYDMIQSGPTVPEMLLTAAEALARQGKTTEALAQVNKLRRARISHESADIDLTAANQQEAIESILEERHREMPFIMRWFDIRRLAYNETDDDDVTVSRAFFAVGNDGADTGAAYIYTLPVKSHRYAQPIPTLELRRSENAMVQNEYDPAADVLTEETELPENASQDGIQYGDYDDEGNWIFTQGGIYFKIDVAAHLLYYYDDMESGWVEFPIDTYNEFYDDGFLIEYFFG